MQQWVIPPQACCRLAALPDAAEPLQRSQLMAALAVGTEIIQLRHIAPQFGLGADLDAALEVLARGSCAIATTRVTRAWFARHRRTMARRVIVEIGFLPRTGIN